jgi:hypothetical protein
MVYIIQNAKNKLANSIVFRRFFEIEVFFIFSGCFFRIKNAGDGARTRNFRRDRAVL